jgi:hypothetical protein
MNIDWVLGQFRKKIIGSILVFPFFLLPFFSPSIFVSFSSFCHLVIYFFTSLLIKSPSFLPIDPYLLTYWLTYIHVFANNASAFQPCHCFSIATIVLIIFWILKKACWWWIVTYLHDFFGFFNEDWQWQTTSHHCHFLLLLFYCRIKRHWQQNFFNFLFHFLLEGTPTTLTTFNECCLHVSISKLFCCFFVI